MQLRTFVKQNMKGKKVMLYVFIEAIRIPKAIKLYLERYGTVNNTRAC